MSRRRDHYSGGFWQSFADLAMGLMAVFALVMVLLLWSQSESNAELREERQSLLEEQQSLIAERTSLLSQTRALEENRSQFALELLGLLAVADEIVRDQEGAERWIQHLFEEDDCLLRMGEGGALHRATGAGGTARAADLYGSGETRLDERGREALASCTSNFTRLAYCLSPDSGSAGEEGLSTARRVRERSRICVGAVPAPDATRVVGRLRSGIDALVLQGNTDRTPLTSRKLPPIQAMGERPLELDELPKAFVGNMHLGAERARQALGHLIGSLQGHDQDSHDALQVLLSRLRIESPSFGRYQVGPAEWREDGCGLEDDCAAARNLSLRLRWKKSELRRPYSVIRERICALLADESSALSLGLGFLADNPGAVDTVAGSDEALRRFVRSLGADRSALRRRFGCRMPTEEQ